MNISENTVKMPTKVYSKNQPFLAKILSRELLVKKGSSKQTYHFALDIKDSEISYKPGDSLAIFPENNPLIVEHILQSLRAKGDELIVDNRSGQSLTIKDFLRFKANLSRLTSSFLKLVYEKTSSHRESLSLLFQKENKEMLMKYLATHHPLDILQNHNIDPLPLQEICSQFGPLLPRFYSISSSQRAHPNEIHLTVALFTYSHSGEERFGVASHFLCNLAKENKTEIPIYLQPSHSFFLPEDHNTPIIMVGPGTGVAPFRAFLQERMEQNAPGKNWLFFGERNKESDFFYGDYFENLESMNHLRLDLAFSRDQEEKIYVQHKMLENSRDLWAWLQEGAYFYVCGDAEKMAKDVDQALLNIAQKEGGLCEEQAKAYLKSLKSEKRYRADVY